MAKRGTKHYLGDVNDAVCVGARLGLLLDFRAGGHNHMVSVFSYLLPNLGAQQVL